MLPSQLEQPQYTLAQNKMRAIIPKTLSLIGLSIIFYIGVVINVVLLDLNATTETITKTVTFIALLALIAAGIYHSLHKASLHYKFYPLKLSFATTQIPYKSITQITKKQNLVDKLFKTYSLELPNFTIKNISQDIDIQTYLQKLVVYAQSRP